MAVKVCGGVLASLVYDHSIAPSDQEGLLLGKIVTSKTDAISDSQISHVKEETTTHIFAYINCGPSLSWYDSAGRIDLDALKSVLSQHSHKDVIGWYKFRRNSSLCVSLRERSVHKHLKEMFPGINEQRFVFLLCGLHCSKQSTNNLDYAFYNNSSNHRKFAAVSCEVLNLGDTAHNEYKMKPSATVNTTEGAFSSTMHEACRRVGQSESMISSVSSLDVINSAVRDKLQKLCQEVTVSEDQVGRLRQEVKVLKAKLKLKEEHLKNQHIPVQSLAKSLSTPKIIIAKSDDNTVPSGGRRQRLSSSGSSPSTRKLLNFESQPSLFDISGEQHSDDALENLISLSDREEEGDCKANRHGNKPSDGVKDSGEESESDQSEIFLGGGVATATTTNGCTNGPNASTPRTASVRYESSGTDGSSQDSMEKRENTSINETFTVHVAKSKKSDTSNPFLTGLSEFGSPKSDISTPLVPDKMDGHGVRKSPRSGSQTPRGRLADKSNDGSVQIDQFKELADVMKNSIVDGKSRNESMKSDVLENSSSLMSP